MQISWLAINNKVKIIIQIDIFGRKLFEGNNQEKKLIFKIIRVY